VASRPNAASAPTKSAETRRLGAAKPLGPQRERFGTNFNFINFKIISIYTNKYINTLKQAFKIDMIPSD
jgi:hypothetical protein